MTVIYITPDQARHVVVVEAATPDEAVTRVLAEIRCAQSAYVVR